MVSHVLIKMRDYAGRRLAPAAERLVVVLEEIRGWAAWSVHNHQKQMMLRVRVSNLVSRLFLPRTPLCRTHWIFLGPTATIISAFRRQPLRNAYSRPTG